jgi:mono/diheme cytochrome c family protein
VRLAVLLVLCACDTRMIDQPKVLPYDEPMRAAPAGAVSREEAAAPSESPPITRALLERGRDRFAVACAACHGLDGSADTPVAHRMHLRPPPSLHEARVVNLADGDVYRAISEGYGLMPSYAAVLSPEDRWAVVAYLRALHGAWTATR